MSKKVSEAKGYEFFNKLRDDAFTTICDDFSGDIAALATPVKSLTKKGRSKLFSCIPVISFEDNKVKYSISVPEFVYNKVNNACVIKTVITVKDNKSVDRIAEYWFTYSQELPISTIELIDEICDKMDEALRKNYYNKFNA